MSYENAISPKCTSTAGSIELRVEPKEKNIGEFTVRRVLPSAERRAVGPFVFFDHMGPVELPPGKGINVRPHPHIGIATITYLFEGEIMHRDSLGYEQPILAGAVNLMTAGKGIVHSERAGSDLDKLAPLHGIQSWMALPSDRAEMEPAFEHVPAASLPRFDVNDVHVCVIMGEAYGHTSPVTAYSPILYLECQLPKCAVLDLPDTYSELAVYVVSGSVDIDDDSYPGGVMAVACSDRQITLAAREDSRVMVIGGASVGKRKLWWNFVATSPERLEQAKQDWKAGRFGSVPGDDEFIPLPE